ncbi:sensor domain-containing diguanylate cyclase [Paenibacillus eucommiae]|uniref:Diguanylate cyclase (GGDEF)-like protein/PAS domain S-box-containing protein n=1 Tax=Paenibacillus eucommiae TaxID=1355755 RepID=A0ABS4J5B6_9BACL|nr:sensor domain-containing diguanylate cyclase [Paenibacillus eucommiae]MBP1995029.1 diguanylate cyclase (GGDEF)-like protein/PAS domain S-box-containing protein [Paenibacillus eucommiae]
MPVCDYNELSGDLCVDLESFLRQIVQEAWDMVGLTDIYGKLLYASDSCDRVIGFRPPNNLEELLSRIDHGYRMDVRKLFFKVIQSGNKEKVEYLFQHANEGWIWLETVAIPIRDVGGEIRQIALVTNDITLRKQQESRLISLAYHDPLTGLPNRRLFKEHLNQALLQARRTGKQLALLYVDIDDFKMINDTMGHDIGDSFLQDFASRIRNCLREVDMFARMGGDEFTILLPMMDSAENVETVARRIFRSIEKPYQLGEHSFHATVSMGIALYPRDGDDFNVLLKHVDMALYQVKEKGRNAFRFFHSDR